MQKNTGKTRVFEAFCGTERKYCRKTEKHNGSKGVGKHCKKHFLEKVYTEKMEIAAFRKKTL